MKKLNLAIVLSLLTPVLYVNAASGNAASGDAVTTRPALPRALIGLGFQEEVVHVRTHHQYSELTFRTGGTASALFTEGASCTLGGITEDNWGTFKTLQALRALGYDETKPAKILNAFWGGDQLQAPIDTTPVGTLEAYLKSTGRNEDGTYKTSVATRLLTAIEYGIATHDLSFIATCQKRGATLTAAHIEFAKTLYGNRCFKPFFESSAYRAVVQSGDKSDEAQQEYFDLILTKLQDLYATQETAT